MRGESCCVAAESLKEGPGWHKYISRFREDIVSAVIAGKYAVSTLFQAAL
jgi:hypothetical protein